jgi:pyruvate-ferredoxin/flavodoxin oxidoreductase
MDGNTAAAHVAYRLNEICAIYPITPSSPMAELADEWSAQGLPNIYGTVPVVQEMQSEGGAAGALHGALQAGALATTFTSSQGLLLMLPNLFKVAGELTSAVVHVAARAVATQALSIFGDHSDVMAARTTGFALLCSGSVQEAHDGALLAQAASLRSRVPFLHFFDGFRTSHELNTLTLLDDDQLRALAPEELVRAHRRRALDPDRPFVRGTAHNPDTFFQAREAANPSYQAVPGLLEKAMDQLAEATGRRYSLFEYHGDPDATRVIVVMGSGAEAAREAAAALRADGEKVGVVQVRLYRPFSAEHLVAAVPASCRAIGVLDRTKEPGAGGEPLYLDVVAAFAQALAGGTRDMPQVIGGRYGLGSKEFTPAHAAAVFAALRSPRPPHGFTVGITDDVTGTSLEPVPIRRPPGDETVEAVFFGLGSDGTVGANKNSVKILAEEAGRYAQGYFVYDSHKSGAQTVSHLRFGPEPIHRPYLIEAASFVACHWAPHLERQDLLAVAAPGATVLLNTPYGPEEVWSHLPASARSQVTEKSLRLFVVDASGVARRAGLGNRTNTVLQTCFFALSGVLPVDQALDHIKATIRATYAHRGEEVLRQNIEAVDSALTHLHQVTVPATPGEPPPATPLVPEEAPAFVRLVTAAMLAGQGDRLPVSALPADGTYPSGTAVWEKRNIAQEVPVWEPDLCVQCGQCAFVCPHSVIQARYFDQAALAGAPEGFPSAPVNARGFPDVRFTLQSSIEDCTGCGLCVEACPVRSPSRPGLRAINLGPKEPRLAQERANLEFFGRLPVNDRSRVDFGQVRGVQFLEPLFEFSGACEGCGETPYLKVLSQLFGDRMLVANATGCSSIYGGNLPVTPWAVNREGRGPAWSNSLFEDDAEFGLGFRLAIDQQQALARRLLRQLAPKVGHSLTTALLEAPQQTESEIRAQRQRVEQLRSVLGALEPDDPVAAELVSVADHLVRRSVWIVGGDGWAYDIGYGGLDHVLASGRDVNVLVLDTEVYSNTGGQASKATPLGAVAKFAAAGKRVPRKDLALQAMSYNNVYVAQVAMGANPQQTLLALREAEAYPGTSLILAYCHCIAHGIEMRQGLRQQQLAVSSGYWPLLRYNPAMAEAGENPFRLDSPRPSIAFADYAQRELRYRALADTRPLEASQLAAQAQKAVTDKYRYYEALAGLAPTPSGPGSAPSGPGPKEVAHG